MMELSALYRNRVTAVDAALAGYFTENCTQRGLLEAMRYSLLSGGKRVRPVLVLSFCEAAGGREEEAMAAACAVEMLHTYSLIHDDLPCMDNDTLRRGKPTNHVVYGETAAALAGDALQAAAFRVLLTGPGDRAALANAAAYLASAAGEYGMCGGQYIDTVLEGESRTEESLRELHGLKTGALLRAACCMGVILGGGSEEQLRCAEEYASNVGLAFQIRDDVLDVTSTAEVLGKSIGSDEANGKTTYLTLLGQKLCEERIAEYTHRAVAVAERAFPDAPFLTWFAEELAGRRS